jgi:oligopeptide transport system permease protein
VTLAQRESVKKVIRFLLGPVISVALVVTLFLSFGGYEIPTFLAWFDFIGILALFVFFTIAQGNVVYVFKRLIEAVVVIFVIATVTFLLLRILPGGPFDSDKALPPEIKANIERKYHFDKPLYYQYGAYISGLVKGDFGESYKYIGRNISEIIAESLPVSIQLGIYCLILAFVIGIPAGVYAAAKHNQWQDSLTMMLAISGVALPTFLVAPLLILFFSMKMGWLPPALWDGPAYYILPVLVLGVRPAAVIARLTRASVLEVIRSDYIRTARAKGLNERTVLFKHVLKNSLIPVLTFSGPLAAGVITGSFVVEAIFAIPGMGKHLVNSVSNRDYPLILGTTFVFAAVLVIANLIVDILYAYFDPRIKLS